MVVTAAGAVCFSQPTTFPFGHPAICSPYNSDNLPSSSFSGRPASNSLKAFADTSIDWKFKMMRLLLCKGRSSEGLCFQLIR